MHARAVNTRWKRGRHVVGQVETFQRKVNVLFYFVREWALEREALKVDEQHRR